MEDLTDNRGADAALATDNRGADAALATGSTLGNYLILRKLGEGGMGLVFEAVDQVVGDRVAIKVLRPQLARDTGAAARFFNEVRALHRLNHPGTVAIRDCGQLEDETAFLVMEYLAGETLKQRVLERGERLSVQEALHIVWQLALTLAAAHEKGIIHRDLKPDNVMVVPDPAAAGGERVKLLDFGIAKLQATAGAEGVDITGIGGGVTGTPAYMSPEQCRGDSVVNESSDVYALGVLCYELLAGQKPYRGEGAGELIGQHLYATPRPLAELAPEVQPELVDLVRRMMAKQPELRPRMHEVAAMLRFYGASLLTGARKPSGATRSPAASSGVRSALTASQARSSGATLGLPVRSGAQRLPAATGAQRAVSAAEAERSTSRARRQRWQIAGAVLAVLLTAAALAALYYLIARAAETPPL